MNWPAWYEIRLAEPLDERWQPWFLGRRAWPPRPGPPAQEPCCAASCATRPRCSARWRACATST